MLALKTNILQIKIEAIEAYSHLSDTNSEQTLKILTGGDIITILINLANEGAMNNVTELLYYT